MTQPPPECRVYTPLGLAKALVHAIQSGPRDYWLDPCMGPGVFIACLREKGIRKERIFGVDIDHNSGVEDKSATTIRGVDFFRWCSSTTRKFDRIVANPPYVAIRKLHPKLQKPLAAFAEDDPSFARRSNYWCAFLSASLRILADNGSLAFVLPAAWDYAQYAEEVRRTIHKKFESVEVHRCLEPLFTEVQEGCVVLVARGYHNDPQVSVRIDHVNPRALITALRNGMSQRNRVRHTSVHADGRLTPFSDLYAVNIGCVTGDARYFLLTESDRLRLDLPVEALRPVLSRARHLSAAYIGSAEWKRLLKANERIWLFQPDDAMLGLKGVRKYLEIGAKTCDFEGYKLSRRDPWYRVPDIKDRATGFLSGMSRVGPWIAFRRKRHLAVTNTLYVVTSKGKLQMDEEAAWALALLSTPVRRQYAEIARRYPDGLVKLEPHDVNALRLPSPDRVKGACEEYARAVNLLVAGNVLDAAKIADGFVRYP